MSIKIEEISHTERLKQDLLDKAKEGSPNKGNWTPEETARAIANGMPWIYGLMSDHDLDSRDIITKYAQGQGFNSLEELKFSLDEIRTQLKSQLPERDWQLYFNQTENIQL